MTQRKQHRPTLVEPALEGMPTEPPPPPTAGDLVAAWCSGYKAVKQVDPDPSVVRRVAGICRSIARDRTDLDSWREAWRAALAAGRMGRFDVVAVLAAGPGPQSTPGRGNHYLAIAQGHTAARQSDRLAAALGAAHQPPALGTAQ